MLWHDSYMHNVNPARHSVPIPSWFKTNVVLELTPIIVLTKYTEIVTDAYCNSHYSHTDMS